MMLLIAVLLAGPVETPFATDAGGAVLTCSASASGALTDCRLEAEKARPARVTCLVERDGRLSACRVERAGRS